MLILSILFFTVAILLVYSLTKDTGENTVHARCSKVEHLAHIEPKQQQQGSLGTNKALRAS